LKAKSFLKSDFILNILLLFVPLTLLAQYLHYENLVFFFACLAIIPLAGWMGKATEHLASCVGEGIGGLLNATFGNACELIIAVTALRAGLFDIVKASITGSIIGNILLVMGASMLAGGLRYDTQTFNRTAATTLATLLALGAISLTVPATFHFSSRAHFNEDDLALGIAIVLFITYILSLIFSLKTHKHLYTPPVDQAAQEAIGVSHWSAKKSISILAVATILVAVMSECLVRNVEHAAATLGMTQVFIGVILVAIIGNAAEHSTAILMAMKNKMDLAINIALGSGAQIALFVAPVLVFLSFFIAPRPMDLFFTPVEVLAVAVSVIILGFVAMDGECNWLEGVQLLAVYAILGTAFFFAGDVKHELGKYKAIKSENAANIHVSKVPRHHVASMFRSSLDLVAQNQSKLEVVLHSSNRLVILDQSGKECFETTEESDIDVLQDAIKLKAYNKPEGMGQMPAIATIKFFDHDILLAVVEFTGYQIYWDNDRKLFSLADNGTGLYNWLKEQGIAMPNLKDEDRSE
jgi:Ca2+:H+ antiporter